MSEPSNVSEYRLYRGAGSAAAIDYTTPIATAPAAGGPTRVPIPPVPGGWPAGTLFFIAVRSVDAGGVEFADPSAILRAEFDADGQLLPPRPDAVAGLTARPAVGRRLGVAWRYRPDAGLPAPCCFELFVAAPQADLEQVMLSPPAASVPADGDGPYAWTSDPLPCQPWRLAVRGVAESGAAGPARSLVARPRDSRAPNILLVQAEVR